MAENVVYLLHNNALLSARGWRLYEAERAAFPGLAIVPVHHPPTTSATKLYLDLFGLGPSEIFVVAVVGALLYGPDTIRGQLRDSGVKNSVVAAKGLRLEREERIKEMLDSAEGRRKDRAWRRVNDLIEDEDATMIDKLAAWEGGGGRTRGERRKKQRNSSPIRIAREYVHATVNLW